MKSSVDLLVDGAFALYLNTGDVVTEIAWTRCISLMHRSQRYPVVSDSLLHLDRMPGKHIHPAGQHEMISAVRFYLSAARILFVET